MSAGAPILVVCPRELDASGIDGQQRLTIGLVEDPRQAVNGDVQVHTVGQILCPPAPDESCLQHHSLPAWDITPVASLAFPLAASMGHLAETQQVPRSRYKGCQWVVGEIQGVFSWVMHSRNQ